MATSLYNKIKSTAETYVKLYEIDLGAGKPMEMQQLQSYQADDFVQTWGHAYMVSQRPGLQGKLDKDRFRAHLQSMVPHLQHVSATVHDVLVDERRRTATVQMTYFLTPKGASEASENDLVWLLEFDESGEKIKSSKEYIDATASTRMGEIIKATKAVGSDDSFTKSTGNSS